MNRLIFALALLAQACGGPADGPARGLDPSDDAGAGGGDETTSTGQPDPTTGPDGGPGGAGGQPDQPAEDGGSGGAGDPAPACEDPIAPPTAYCYPSGAVCGNATTCGPWFYLCDAQGAPPPTAGGCTRMVEGGSVFCCTAQTCVHSAQFDPVCAAYGLPGLAYTCATDDQTNLTAGCVVMPGGMPSGQGWCCP